MELELILKQNFPKLTAEYMQFALDKHNCRQCSLYNDYSAAPIQSEGCTIKPVFMFIGEAPGAEEIGQNRPFIGAAGQRLRQELRKYPSIFNKQNTLISNVLSCRPMKNKFPSANNHYTVNGITGCPGKVVVKHCFDTWVQREIKLVDPKIVVTIGSHSLGHIRNDKGITQHHGTWKRLEDQRWCFSLYHPSYVLRCRNDNNMKHIETEFDADIKALSETYEEHLD